MADEQTTPAPAVTETPPPAPAVTETPAPAPAPKKAAPAPATPQDETVPGGRYLLSDGETYVNANGEVVK